MGRRTGTLPFPDRFWAKVDRTGGPDACWPWLGARNQAEHVTKSGRRFKGGHGRVRIADQIEVASRVAVLLGDPEEYDRPGGRIGPRRLPSGEKALHQCDNPPCCNPAHLLAGTQGQNIHESYVRGRRRRRREMVAA